MNHQPTCDIIRLGKQGNHHKTLCTCKPSTPVKYVNCEETGESILELRDGKITALAACTITIGEGTIKAVKNQSIPIPARREQLSIL